MKENDMHIAQSLPQWAAIALPAVIVWDLVWRGLALWRAARRSQTVWFVVLMILNTAGILPIIYLLLTRGEMKK
jgi:hypothetical protein